MKSRHLVLIGILYLLAALGIIYHLHNRTKNILMDHIDQQLVNAALATDAILGREYHTNILGPESKSEKEDWNTIQRLTGYANKTGMTYLYTAVRRGKLIYLTSSSASKEEIENDVYVKFFDPYPDASKGMHQAFFQQPPVFSIYTDRWGRFRAVYIKRISPDKTPYVTCAELSLEQYDNILKSRIIEHSSMAIIIFSMFVIFTVMLFFYMRRKEATLMEARKAAEYGMRANRAKDEFLAVISHEVRTPLNGILGANKLLKQTRLSNEQAELSELVNASGNKLMRIIDDILEISRIEAGGTKICQDRFDLLELLDRAMGMAAFQVGDKALSMGYVIAPQVPRYLIQDEGRLHQVLMNLVSNAVKFTEKGRILISVSHMRSSGDLFLAFEVSDTGVGINKKDHAHIFDIFSQADATSSRKYGGTGLGLTICERLVKAMGGDISVVSTPGRGSTFRFRVKCTAPDQGDWLSDLRKKALKAVVGVTDPFTKQCLESLLDYFHIPFEEIKSTAMDHVATRDNMWIVDQDTASGLFRLPPPFIAFRVAVITNTKSKSTDNFSRLQIPLCSRKLLTLFYEPVEKTVPGESGTYSQGSSQKANLRPLVVLCADDNQMNRKITVKMLEKMGHNADEAHNGKAVLDACENRDYDLILMDMQMPEMDGMEATRALKTKYGEKSPVIIALTANALPEHAEACKKAGMDDYLAKPLDPDILKDTLHRSGFKVSNRL